jgi:hypothetical protein
VPGAALVVAERFRLDLFEFRVEILEPPLGGEGVDEGVEAVRYCEPACCCIC